MMQAVSGMEEVPMGEALKYMLKPFTAAKSSDAVAGDDGPVMRFPVKRKTVAGFSCEEGLQPAEEAKLPAADKHGVDVSAAVAVPGRKHRLSEDEIRFIIDAKPGPLPLPTANYLDDMKDAFSPEYIKERKQQLKDETEMFRKMDEEWEVFRQQVIKSVREIGYFEVDDEFLINREKLNQWSLEEAEKKDFGGLRFATDEEEEEMLSHLCLPEKDDDAVLVF